MTQKLINELKKDKGFRGFRRLDGNEYLTFEIRRGSFDCLSRKTFILYASRLYLLVKDGRVIDVRFGGSPDADTGSITKNSEKKLKRLIYREIY